MFERVPFQLDRYLALCKAGGLRPMVGVNYNCHNYQKCTETPDESIARAVRQVKHVVEAGFAGAFWYCNHCCNHYDVARAVTQRPGEGG